MGDSKMNLRIEVMVSFRVRLGLSCFVFLDFDCFVVSYTLLRSLISCHLIIPFRLFWLELVYLARSSLSFDLIFLMSSLSSHHLYSHLQYFANHNVKLIRHGRKGRREHIFLGRARALWLGLYFLEFNP